MLRAAVVVRHDLAKVLTSGRFVHNLYTDTHRNGRTSGHKARPGDQLNTRFLRSLLAVLDFNKFARQNA